MPGEALFQFMQAQGLESNQGRVTWTEFAKLIAKVGWSEEVGRRMWEDNDTNRNGFLEQSEFLAFANHPDVQPYIVKIESDMYGGAAPPAQAPGAPPAYGAAAPAAMAMNPVPVMAQPVAAQAPLIMQVPSQIGCVQCKQIMGVAPGTPVGAVVTCPSCQAQNVVPQGPAVASIDFRSMLAGHPSLLVRQKVDLLEAVTGGVIQQGNKYKIAAVPPGWVDNQWNDDLFLAAPIQMNMKEESDMCMRQVMGPVRELDMHLKIGENKQNPTVMTFHKHQSCLCPCLNSCDSCVPKVDALASGASLGHAELKPEFFRNWCMNSYEFEIKDPQGTPVYVIDDNACCNENCFAPSPCCQVRNMPILDANSRQPVGQIQNFFSCSIRRCCFSDYDQYRVDFPVSATPDQKALILAGLILVEFARFEKTQQERNQNANTGLDAMATF